MSREAESYGGTKKMRDDMDDLSVKKRKVSREVRIEEANNGTVISFAGGNIDGANREFLRETLKRLFKEGCQLVSIDMSNTVSVETGFFGVINFHTDRGNQVEIINPSERVQEIMNTRKRIATDLENGI